MAGRMDNCVGVWLENGCMEEQVDGKGNLTD
jgi:hypothetical protein